MLENGNAHQESVADSGKYTVMMNMAPSHPKTNLHPGYIRQQRRASKRVVAIMLFQTQFGRLWRKPAECERPRQHGNGPSQKGQEYGQRKNVNSRKAPALGISTQTHVTTVAHLDIGRKTGGNLVEMQITAPTAVSTRAKAR